jgi:SAM-dependent methyltransferase
VTSPKAKRQEFREAFGAAIRKRWADTARPGGFVETGWLWQQTPERTHARTFFLARTFVCGVGVALFWGMPWVVLALLLAHFGPFLFQLIRMAVSQSFGSNVMMPTLMLGLWLASLAKPALQLLLGGGGLALLVWAEDWPGRLLGVALIYLCVLDLEVNRWLQVRQRINPDLVRGFSRGPLNDAIVATALQVPNPALLDIACGDGSTFLARVAPKILKVGGRATGVDANPNGIAAGRKATPDLDLHVGDAQDLPFDDNSFDVVTSFGGVNNPSMGSAALAEMFRVCKPGGTVFLLDEQLSRGASWFERQYFYRVIASIRSNSWMLDDAPINYLPPEAVNLRVVQAGSSYYILKAEKVSATASTGATQDSAARA